MAAANVPHDALLSGMTQPAETSHTLLGGMSAPNGAAAHGGKPNGASTSTLPPPPAPAGSAAPVPAVPAPSAAADDAPRPRSLSVPPPRTDSTLAGIAPPAAAPDPTEPSGPPDKPHQS
jgi:hypothetical protein